MKKRISVVLRWKVNALARVFYMLQGYNVEEGYDFSKASTPPMRGPKLDVVL